MRFFHRSRYSDFTTMMIVLTAIACLVLPGAAPLAEESTAGDHMSEYRFDSGDKLNITVFNQSDLSGEYTINGDGDLSMPLIGKVRAKNLTVKQLEEAIVDVLKPDYLLNPRVSVQVLNYRPFYIIGEVNSPQSYPYVSGMTYLNAVAIAGGFTYRAVKDYVYVIRAGDPEKKEKKLSIDAPVMPGDVIRVDERFF